MGYEDLVNKIDNQEEFFETPVYGRVKSDDEREYYLLEDEYYNEQEQYEEEKELYEKEKASYEKIKARISRNLYGNSEEVEEKKNDLDDIETELIRLDNENTEKENAWNQKKSDKENNKGKWEKWASQKVLWDAADEEWENKEYSEKEALKLKINEILKNNEGLNENNNTRNDDIYYYDNSDDEFNDRYELGKHAKRALEQAVKLNRDKDGYNIETYEKIFVEDLSMDFEKHVTGESEYDRPKTREDKTAAENYNKLKQIFLSKNPQNEEGFLDAVYTKLKLIMDTEAINKQKTKDLANQNKKANPYANPFFSDRGNSYALADDAALVKNANKLINLYELAEHADDFIKMLPEVSAENTKETIERENIIERMNMLKSQKGFMREEIMRLEALANPCAPNFDLNDLDTIRRLSEFYEAGNEDKKMDPDFWALCKNCSERWKFRAAIEVEAAESLLKECLDEEKKSGTEKPDIQMMFVVSGKEVTKPFNLEEAKNVLLTLKGADTLKLFFNRTDEDGQNEKITLDLKNDGKMSWATYKTQIDCDCSSLDPATLPKKPHLGKRIWHQIKKFFSKVGVAEVEEYEKAKAKLEEATRNAKEFMKKKQASNLTVDEQVEDDNYKMDNDNRDADVQSVQDLLEQEQKEREEWEKLQAEVTKCQAWWEEVRNGEYAQFREKWDKLTPQEQNAEKEKAERYFSLKEKWEKASETDRQKSRITALRSSKMLERRAVKKAEDRAIKREEIKTGVQTIAKDFTAELLKNTEAFAIFGDDEINDILVGKSVSGVDCEKMSYHRLTEAIGKIQKTIKEFKDDDSHWKSDSDFEIVADKALDLRTNSWLSEKKYAEARYYFTGQSELEVFDGLCDEQRNVKDKGKRDALLSKRRSMLGKAIILRAEERVAKLKELVFPAEEKVIDKWLNREKPTDQEIRNALSGIIRDRIVKEIDDARKQNPKLHGLSHDQLKDHAPELYARTKAYWALVADLNNNANKNGGDPAKKEKSDTRTIFNKFAELSESNKDNLLSELSSEIRNYKRVSKLQKLVEEEGHTKFKNDPRYKAIFENPFNADILNQEAPEKKAENNLVKE